MPIRHAVLMAALAAGICVSAVHGQGKTPPTVPSLYQELRYRVIGPHRASRTVGAVGIPTQPNVFFMGVNNGGVWKTDDYGRTWTPIFDEAPTGSIGDIAVSPSHPDVLYVGSGEGLHRPDLGVGDGIFKSTNGGKTWQHVGLPDVQQVGRLVVHPTNPDCVFVAGTCEYRSDDGGRTWTAIKGAPGGDDPQRLWINPLQPDIMLLTADQGATITVNGGRT